MMATANARHRRTGKTTVVRKSTTAEATQQLHNIMRINGWAGSLADILPGVRINHGAFTYWVDSEEGER